jgi:hypothetical protein
MAELVVGNNATMEHFKWDESGAEPCRDHWAAVRCDHSMPRRRITSFHVRKTLLDTEFPVKLLGLTALKILGMVSAGLTGKLPDEIGQALPLLQYINFADNLFSGSLPASMSLLQHLH